MNYPVWDVAFGAGLLMAGISILHVFVSHFAVGGGLFLVLTEKRAYRKNGVRSSETVFVRRIAGRACQGYP
jgi:hypothetical protein